MRHVLIIGATSGIGKALAHQYAKEKYPLVLTARDRKEMERIASDIHIRHHVPVSVKTIDAESFDTHADFFASCVEEAGKLSGMFLVHGYMIDQETAQNDFTKAKKMIDVNFTSYVSLLETAARYFERERSGFIGVITSVAGDRGRKSNYIYGSSKGALSVYVQGLRNRLYASGVHVATIKPGFVDTKMTYGLNGLFLVAQPEDAAKRVHESIRKKHDVIYVPGFWWMIMFIIKSIPERVFKRLKL
ncbi:SDR family oxidoreductase [Alteribacillus bidgolensis]|uniref:Short-chain dehydrogenase n=1 Tax=Alteribacillus bidgolensis TaxID=930129 RepID=A0A1G8NFW1_9BACI|nr:SDR family oxidoreductase [Alteribacillus bidgolensis]SDI79048.1 Short-chain dehydrogenase [Alteribacillus bidgolensis]